MNYLDKPLQVEEHWWKAGEMQKAWPAEFLRAHEATCVTACDRFLNASYPEDSIWLLSRGSRAARAILMYSRRTLFPVFDGLSVIPVPMFLKRFLLATPVRAIHGLLEDVSLLEAALYPLHYETIGTVNYYLMAYDHSVVSPKKFSPIPGLTLRPVKQSDYKALFEMQMSYEMEEVAINMKRYRPELARLSLSRILGQEDMLVAEYEKKLVGKINTNARSFTRRQLGGIYVKPPYRRKGIASAMVAAMAEKFSRENTALSLYVRKSNTPALHVYKHAGFRTVADYRISYIE
jgi:ribosomal protein S18 acetylase RimI-like enzyme